HRIDRQIIGCLHRRSEVEDDGLVGLADLLERPAGDSAPGHGARVESEFAHDLAPMVSSRSPGGGKGILPEEAADREGEIESRRWSSGSGASGWLLRNGGASSSSPLRRSWPSGS